MEIVADADDISQNMEIYGGIVVVFYFDDSRRIRVKNMSVTMNTHAAFNMAK